MFLALVVTRAAVEVESPTCVLLAGTRKLSSALLGLICALSMGCGAVEPLPASTPSADSPDQWAAQVCAAAQGFLAAFTYSEPYGVITSDVTLEDFKIHSRTTTPRIIAAAHLVSEALREMGAVREDTYPYQQELQLAFRNLAEVYEQSGRAVLAARSSQEVNAINTETLLASREILLSVTRALDMLPPIPRSALKRASNCVVLS